jgi:hypothetical protein
VRPQSGAPESKVASAPALRPPTADELADVAQMWNRVERACGGNRRLEILVGDMSLREASHDRAVVVVDSKLISTARSHTYEIETALHAAFGRTMKVDFSAATEAHAPVVAAEAKALPNMNEHPLVRQAVQLLNARLVRVEPRAE